MRARICLLSLLCAGVCAAPAGAVSGGRTVPFKDAPYVARLSEGCSGTLIAPDRVLTAGHCLDDFSPANFTVKFGSETVHARGFSVHPRFKESFPFAHDAPQNAIAQFDVGLILLAKPVTDVQPVKLASGKVGQTATILGFGQTTPQAGPPPKTLQAGDMTVISRSRCAHAYPGGAIIASEICGEDLAHTHAPWVQACGGDSGGPFVVKTSGGPVQIGVTSWGPEVMDGKCGRLHLPGVYMRVSSFTSFIDEPDPVIEPFVADPFNQFPRVTGDPHVGATLTCNPPPFQGSPSTLTYKWVFNNKTVSTKQTAVATSAMAGHAVRCEVTARNAGGHAELFTPAAGSLKIES